MPKVHTGLWCGKCDRRKGRVVQVLDAQSRSLGVARAVVAGLVTLDAQTIAPYGRRARQVWVLTGCLALALGALVYGTDRPAGAAWLVPSLPLLAGWHLFGPLGGMLPSFFHPLAFSLFTAAALPTTDRPAYGACAGWFAVNALFEVGQHATIAPVLAAWLQPLPGVGHRLAAYFSHGRFDVADLAAALLGALLAAALLHRFQSRRHDVGKPI